MVAIRFAIGRPVSMAVSGVVDRHIVVNLNREYRCKFRSQLGQTIQRRHSMNTTQSLVRPARSSVTSWSQDSSLQHVLLR
jgi:hypothetical protein